MDYKSKKSLGPLSSSSSIYRVFVNTGSNFPQKDVIKKWDEGTVKITINPDGVVGCESHILKINKPFNAHKMGFTEDVFWVPEFKGNSGEPKLLKIEIEGTCLQKYPIFIREVAVQWEFKTYRFPIHNFLSPYTPMGGRTDTLQDGCLPYLYSVPGGGTLKHQEHDQAILDARDWSLNFVRSVVKWEQNVSPAGAAGYIAVKKYKHLPRFLKFRLAKTDAFEAGIHDATDEIVGSVAKGILHGLMGQRHHEQNHGWKDFHSYEVSFLKMAEMCRWKVDDIRDGLWVGEHFHKDHEFGRQILQGPNSINLRRVNEISAPWKEAIEKGFLKSYAIDGEDPQQVIKEGRLFEVLNSKELDGVADGGDQSMILLCEHQTWYVVQADVLLFQSKRLPVHESFVPVLIRLEYKNGQEPQTFWYPPEQRVDPMYYSWLLAKMHFRCADWQVYSLGTHYARAHTMNEVFAVSMYRNLPFQHPLFRILWPHLQGIIAINAQARQVLVNPSNNAFAKFMSAGDHLADLLVNCCTELKYDSMVIPKDFETRGLNDTSTVKLQYLFRDDSVSSWNILHEYATGMVDLSYKAEEDVSGDVELQDFVKEIANIGFAGFRDNKGAGFPTSISTKKELAEYMTVVIYNASWYHASVNFQINKYLAYMPNAPPSVLKPPPGQDNVATLEQIMETIPKYEIAVTTMALTEVLGNFSPIERFYLPTKTDNRSGYLGGNMAVSLEQEKCINKMERNMEKLRVAIVERNENSQTIPYTVMRPDLVPIATQI